MPKQYKIKRYHRFSKRDRARPHPISVILTIAGIGLLVFIGISIYEPVYNFIMGRYEPSADISSSQGDSAGQIPAALADPAEPDPLPVAKNTNIQAVYMPLDIARDPAALDAFLAGLAGTPVNAVMVDIKDKEGTVLFQTQNEQANQWGVVSNAPLGMSGLTQALHEHDLSLVVRMSAFRDEKAASGDWDYAIQYANSDSRWHDGDPKAGGKPWLNPYHEGVRAYLTALAVEAVELGADFVLLEDVQFPDGSLSVNANFGPEAQTVSRPEMLGRFLEEVTAAVEEKGGRVGVYLTAASPTHTDANPARYGGNPMDIVRGTVVLGVLPYQFGSEVTLGDVELSAPSQDPTGTVQAAIQFARGQLPADTVVIPLIQGGSEPAINTVVVDAAVVTQQTEAAVSQGCEEYVLYQTAGAYALSPAGES